MLFIATAAITAFIVGFAMKRGGLCTYVATLQIIQQRTAERMFTFLGAAAWATIVIVPLSWWFPDWVKLSYTHNYITTTIVGGLIIGLGAYLNKGCMFGTFVQLVGGNLTYLATLIGMSIGAAMTYQFFVKSIPITLNITQVAQPGLIAYCWLLFAALFALRMLFQISPTSDSRNNSIKRPRLRQRQAIFIMLILGVGGGLLSTTISGWDYASVLTKITFITIDPHATGPKTLAIICAFSMIAGGIYAAISADNFKIQSPQLFPFIACLAGGSLMGAAAIIIPGGNDGMLLKGIPSLASHAIIAYAIMITAMLGLIAIFRSKPT